MAEKVLGRKQPWGRVHCVGGDLSAHTSPVRTGPSPSGSRAASGARAARPSTGIRASAGHPPARAAGGPAQAELRNLNTQLQEMQATCEGLEKERDFYFAKLRSIELIIADRINLEHVDVEERETLQKVQDVLYQTEEGFEVGGGCLRVRA